MVKVDKFPSATNRVFYVESVGYPCRKEKNLYLKNLKDTSAFNTYLLSTFYQSKNEFVQDLNLDNLYRLSNELSSRSLIKDTQYAVWGKSDLFIGHPDNFRFFISDCTENPNMIWINAANLAPHKNLLINFSECSLLTKLDAEKRKNE